jgi:hypothetical protein
MLGGAMMTRTLEGGRSLEEALADLREKLRFTSENSRKRAGLERMILVLERELAKRKVGPQ